ncbi:MAG: hypothetical protein AAGF81_04600 [Pseudomonadota bacterium]
MEIEFLDEAIKEEDGLVNMPMAAVFLAVKSVLETGAQREFIAACEERKMSLRGPIEIVNFAKTFVNENTPDIDSFAESASASRASAFLKCRDPSRCPNDV